MDEQIDQTHVGGRAAGAALRQMFRFKNATRLFYMKFYKSDRNKETKGRSQMSELSTIGIHVSVEVLMQLNKNDLVH